MLPILPVALFVAARMKKGNFGETLRREREMRGVSLEEVANATRISTRNLEALENERWDQLPGGVFNRGFIRSISRFLGLDEETLVSEYVIATDDQPHMAVWADKAGARKPSRLPMILTGTIAAFVLAACFFVWRDWALVKAAVTGRASAQPAANPVPQPPLPAPRPPQTEPETLRLKIDAAKTTTVKILADGETSLDGRLEARTSRTFTAKEKFEITVGDSFAVLLELNGQAVAPIGQPGQPGTITLTRKDLVKPEGAH